MSMDNTHNTANYKRVEEMTIPFRIDAAARSKLYFPMSVQRVEK
jgi:hypothetical protein